MYGTIHMNQVGTGVKNNINIHILTFVDQVLK